MDISLENVSQETLGTLKNLFVLAAYDLTELNGANIGEDGLFTVNFNFMDWYNDPIYNLFFIRDNGFLVGFVVVKQIPEEDLYYLNHFFILRKYRNKKIGQVVAIKIFETFKGNWRVSEFDWNTPAQIFWRKVVSRYTNNKFNETRRKDNKGPSQEFSNLFV